MFYRIQFRHTAFGLRVENGIVHDAPEPYKWTIGKSFKDIEVWTKEQGGSIQEANYI